ncbi:MAG: SDR family oxidoreductase [Chloroflexi bacterium]|nr:SDR family oxidoreductase [Chloroflexota bacterium]
MADSGFRLDGRVAVVTGGSQGIGRAVSLALAEAGAAVAVTNVRQKKADVDALCAEITAGGGTAKGYELDVTDTPSIPAVMDRIAAELGGLDVLVNNAGVRSEKPSVELTEAEWDAVLGVNLKGTFFCAQAAARHMLERGHGRIVNVASQLAVAAAPERAAYVASKGGVVALTKVLALEWVSKGITVNAIGPGPTETPMTMRPDAAPVSARSPLGRRLKPEEVAGAVVFLASPAGAAVNGHLLLVDGGWTAG